MDVQVLQGPGEGVRSHGAEGTKDLMWGSRSQTHVQMRIASALSCSPLTLYAQVSLEFVAIYLPQPQDHWDGGHVAPRLTANKSHSFLHKYWGKKPLSGNWIFLDSSNYLFLELHFDQAEVLGGGSSGKGSDTAFCSSKSYTVSSFGDFCLSGTGSPLQQTDLELTYYLPSKAGLQCHSLFFGGWVDRREPPQPFLWI